MHDLKPYLVDFSTLTLTILAKIYASITGLSLEFLNVQWDKVAYVLVMLITGFTTLYRFVKEVKNDKREKRERLQKEKEAKEKTNN